MRNSYLLSISFIFFCSIAVQAQITKTVTIKAGSSIEETIPAGELFLYPNYKPGIAFYKNGKMAGADVNYNLLTDEMEFISPKKDTLTITGENSIQYLVIDKDTFYYDKGYLQLVYINPLIKLAKRQRIKIIDREKIGAYGQATTTSAIDNYDRVGLKKLTVSENTILGWQTIYFIATDNNHFAIINRKSLFDALPQQHDAITEYLKNNRVNFNKEEDVIKLLNSLQVK